MSGPIYVVGIDPGVEGASALVHLGDAGPTVLDARPLPINRGPGSPIGDRSTVCRTRLRNDLLIYEEKTAPWGKLYAAVERQDIRPRQHGHAAIMFNYGVVATVAGRIIGERDIAWPLPADWKRNMGLSSSKRQSMTTATAVFGNEAAAQFWPIVAREGVAEAALLAYWRARRLRMIADARRGEAEEGRLPGPGAAP